MKKKRDLVQGTSARKKIPDGIGKIPGLPVSFLLTNLVDFNVDFNLPLQLYRVFISWGTLSGFSQHS
jgi:hypothetical protein